MQIPKVKKVLFVATVFDFLSFEESDMNILHNMGYEVHTATNMNSDDWLKDDGHLNYLGIVKHQIDFGRSPFTKNTFIAYRQLKTLLRDEFFDIVHCHTPVASTILRLAAIETRKKGTKVIYTDHGFHFHKKSSKMNWLLYYPMEYIMSYFTDMLITINKEDYEVIQRFPVKTKRYIPGVGVDTNAIENTPCEIGNVRDSFGIPQNAFVVMSIGELSKRKNQEVIIRALSEISNKDIYYLICGTGDQMDYLKNLSEKLGVSQNVIFAGFQPHSRIMQIVHAVDLGALPSLIEGLGLAGIEMMAAGKPVVASGVHGINDYVIDRETGMRCNPFDANSFAKAINLFYSDRDLYRKCCSKSLIKSKEFDITVSKSLMSKIYKEVVNK